MDNENKDKDKDKDSKPLPKWTEKFFFLIYQCWAYHAPCEHINIQAFFNQEEKHWEIKAAPVFQEIYGGDDDGKKIWAGFAFDLTAFSHCNGMWIMDQTILSRCSECSDYPELMIQGKFKGHRFVLQIFLEPVSDEPVELVDTINHEIRDILIQEES
jgi:hypothetical protein